MQFIAMIHYKGFLMNENLLVELSYTDKTDKIHISSVKEDRVLPGCLVLDKVYIINNHDGVIKFYMYTLSDNFKASEEIVFTKALEYMISINHTNAVSKLSKYLDIDKLLK